MKVIAIQSTKQSTGNRCFIVAYFLDRSDIGTIVDEVRLDTPYGQANKVSVMDMGGGIIQFDLLRSFVS